MDKTMIVSNLEILSNYIKKDIEHTNTSIEHWKKRVEEIGEGTIAFPIENETYGETLDRSIENKKYLMKLLEDNNNLINTLRKGEKGRDETD